MNHQKKKNTSWVSFCLILFLLPLSFAQEKAPEDTFVIKGGKIYTSGPMGVLQDAHLLIEKGKIKKIFKGGDLPQAPVVDYSGRFISPGFVDGHTHLSGYFRLLENTEAITSDLIAAAAFNPFHPEVRNAIESGITTVNLSSRSENLVGGMSSVFKLFKDFKSWHMLKKEAFLKISLNAEMRRDDRPPTSLIGAETILDEELKKIRDRKRTGREEIFQQEGLRRLADGKILPLVAASTYEEIHTALEWLERWHLKGAIIGGEEAHLFKKELKKREIPVLLSPLLFSFPDRMAENAASLLREGIKVAFVSDMPEADPLYLRYSALLLVHQGLPQEEALKTLTLFPAQILGVGDIVGSLEEGKDADFLVFSGEPLDLSSKLLAVYSDGHPLYKKEK